MKKKQKQIRVRFAPSPTGPLHIGGLRTALYNYLYAKKNKGKFILRIEDTDTSRFIPGAEEYILKSLEWCGISPDESPQKEGKYGPYKQSERTSLYKNKIKELIDLGLAYIAFDTPRDLNLAREEKQKKSKEPFQYNWETRLKMKNSLTLNTEKLKQLKKKNTPYVVRAKILPGKKILIKDLIRGKVEVNTRTLDDKVLFKTDKTPTYHFANVVDDYYMKITHVIRGEEWLPSTPLHFFLYKAFGWEKEKPTFIHLPLILKPKGEGKMSKRDGLKMGYPVFPISWTENNNKIKGFKEKGFLPESLLNTLALLGWNPGTEKEIFNKKELIKEFTLKNVLKSGARFNFEKAKWINQQVLQKKETRKVLKKELFKEIKKRDKKPIKKEEEIVLLIQKRLESLEDIWKEASVFYESPKNQNRELIRKKWKKNTNELLKKLSLKQQTQKKFQSKEIKKTIEVFTKENNCSLGEVLVPLRIILTGKKTGPDLFFIMEILGKKEVLARLKKNESTTKN